MSSRERDLQLSQEVATIANAIRGREFGGTGGYRYLDILEEVAQRLQAIEPLLTLGAPDEPLFPLDIPEHSEPGPWIVMRSGRVLRLAFTAAADFRWVDDHSTAAHIPPLPFTVAAAALDATITEK